MSSFKAEVIADSSGKWSGNALRFATEEEAKDYAAHKAATWMPVTDTRVVPSDDPANYAWRDGKVVALEPMAGITIALADELLPPAIPERQARMVSEAEQALGIRIRVVDAPCPVCGSDQTRSKVENPAGTWWYVCDDYQAEHVITKSAQRREAINLNDKAGYAFRRFYFALDGRLDVPGYGVLEAGDWLVAPVVPMGDPSMSEMREYLDALADAHDAADHKFDREEAIYWFASHWHGGQTTNLYEALSTSRFEPGPLARGPAEAAQLMYDALEEHFRIGSTD